VDTAEELRDHGAVLQQGAVFLVPTPARGGSGAGLLYANRMCAREFIGSDVHQTRADYRESWGRHFAAFRVLPDAERAECEHAVGINRRKPRVSGQETRAVKRDVDAHFGLATRTRPVNTAAFVGAATQQETLDYSDSFRSWGPAARAEFVKQLFRENNDCIPPKTRFREDRSCKQAHADVCCTLDVAIYNFLLRFGKEFGTST
jgi:hypothetical protein